MVTNWMPLHDTDATKGTLCVNVGHVAVAHLDGEAVAVQLFTAVGELAGGRLAGLNLDLLAISPLKAFFDCTADQRLHLGAGRGGHEENRFSPIRNDFKLGRWILENPAYEELVRARFGDAEPDVPFFPAYRSPTASGMALR